MGCLTTGPAIFFTRMVHAHSRLRVIDNPGRIISMGLNTAIQAASGSTIIRMDAHSRYDADYIRQCLAVLQESGADNVGGPWVAEGRGFIGKAVSRRISIPVCRWWSPKP